MKLIVLLLASVSILTLSSCDKKKVPEEDTTIEHEAEKGIHAVIHGDAEIIIIDGCEYMIYKAKIGSNRGYGFMAHKGNCKNPIHIYRKSETDKTTP